MHGNTGSLAVLEQDSDIAYLIDFVRRTSRMPYTNASLAT
jgi:hypothetical protein